VTAIVAIHTPKFTVIAADTLFVGAGRFYGHKLTKVGGGNLVLGEAGAMGPICRRIQKQWAKIDTVADLRAAIIAHANSVETHEMDAHVVGGDIVQESILVASREGICSLDNSGSRTEALPLTRNTYVEAVGCGRPDTLGYVFGFMQNAPKNFLDSAERVSVLLTEAINHTARFDSGVGGAVDVEVIR